MKGLDFNYKDNKPIELNETRSVLSSEELSYEGGNRTLNTPPYKVDIALGIKRG